MRRWSVLLVATCAAAVQAVEPRTVVTGDQMEISGKGRTVVFAGNARVTRGDSVLTADRIVQDKADNRVDASGNVTFRALTREREPFWGSAAAATYRPAAGTGSLSGGRPTVFYAARASTGPLHMTADRIAFDERRGELSGAGAVEIVTTSATARGPNALFDERSRTVLMTADAGIRPEVVYSDPGRPACYTADRITAHTERRRVHLQGAVRGRIAHAPAPQENAR